MTERQPWRYRCPKCNSVQIRRYGGWRMPSRSEIAGRKLHHSGNVRQGVTAIPRYHCQNCHAKFDTPVDMLISGSIPDGRKQDPAGKNQPVHSSTMPAEPFYTSAADLCVFCGQFYSFQPLSAVDRVPASGRRRSWFESNRGYSSSRLSSARSERGTETKCLAILFSRSEVAGSNPIGGFS